ACRAWLNQLQGAEPSGDLEVVAAAFQRQLSTVHQSKALRDELRDRIKHGASVDPQDLVMMLLCDLASLRPVVILDGLDKLPPQQARETFLDPKTKPMAKMPGAAVLTIPLSIVYEPTFNVLGERYNNAGSAVLPAVRPWELDPVARKRTP